MDQIKIENLEIYAGHGVLSEETRNGQLFTICATLYLNLQPAGQTDDLTLSTHYGEVCQFMNRFLKKNTYLLIEAVAEHLADAVLLAFPLIQELELEVKKPQAPIGLPLSYVAVKIKRGWKQVYISIGSNMGNKKQFIEEALYKMNQNTKIRNIRCSKLIQTKPYGGVEQDDFLNGAIALKTLLNPWKLLDYVHELEQEAGRERKIHWGPRTLDLDILYYEDFISAEPELTVPHKDMRNRRFVLEPLSEICPYYKDPITGQSIEQMLQNISECEC